jgi:hypothetical protein
LTARKDILENLQVRFPTAKVSVRKASEKSSSGSVAYIATIKNTQGFGLKDLPKIMILSFDSSGKEIQNPEV